VTTPKGFKQAYDKYCEGGWIGLSVPEEYGGQGLPYTLHSAVGEYMSSANMALMMYPGLTMGAIAAILVHGSDEQKKTYLPKMVAGVWSGTMNLTEPHCGTDLGLLRTKAVPQADGSYKITGTEDLHLGRRTRHDREHHPSGAGPHRGRAGRHQGHLAVHRAEIHVKADGSVGARNGVSCGAIEHKMGIHGNSTCVMNYDGATGWLIGEENKGLQRHVRDDERGPPRRRPAGSGVSPKSPIRTRPYARDRIQGRSLTGPKAPDKKADPIIVHPDVRRTLMQIRAFNEAGRAFVLWTALQIRHRPPLADAPSARRPTTSSA
jgi:acyl-CoA dehydrogenase